MRPAGYYFVRLHEKEYISYFEDNHFEIHGLVSTYEDADFTYISPTPITPEKMMAIEEIVKACAEWEGYESVPSEAVLDILNKYKLLNS
ncbi:MAG: hypothetical protein K0Q79_2764 [Flavipsychrobacter sp.]|nr:hypothetical protein [Flavipsychrobacter sp.]